MNNSWIELLWIIPLFIVLMVFANRLRIGRQWRRRPREIADHDRLPRRAARIEAIRGIRILMR